MANKEKKLIIWSKVVDFVTVIWLLHFVIDLSTDLISNSYSTFFSYFIYIFFIIDLLIIFITHNSKKHLFINVFIVRFVSILTPYNISNV